MDNVSKVKPIKIAIIATFFFFILFGHIKASADQKEVDINTSKNPNGYLFEVGNLKPGDWMPRNLTIFNEGIKDFKYTALIGEKKSVKGLLEELDLLIKKDEIILYDGKMDKFQGFTPRNLASGSSETLFFQVTMPLELGNQFQESSAEVEIKFLAEIIPGEDDGDDDNDDNDNGDNGDNNNDNETPDETTPGNGGDDSSDDKTQGNTPIENNSPDEEPNIDNLITGDETMMENEPLPQDTEDPVKKVINITPKITEKLLPNTATNIYNFMFYGAVLLTIGLSLYMKYYFKIRREYK